MLTLYLEFCDPSYTLIQYFLVYACHLSISTQLCMTHLLDILGDYETGINIARWIGILVAMIVVNIYAFNKPGSDSSSSYFQLGKMVGSISPPLILQFFMIVTGIAFSNSIFFMKCSTK
ncbi:hypothetical protein D1007_26672 [Hordeum vulgare]|nr:hypothetical protein D1007_26672 [Hordeum vulgare]